MRGFVLLPMLVLLQPAAAKADTVPATCANLQTKLDDATVADITLQAGQICDGTFYLRNHDVTLRGATDSAGKNLAGFTDTGSGRSLTTDAGCARARLSCRVVSATQVIDHLDFRGNDGNGGGMKWQGTNLTVSNSLFSGVTTNGPGGGLLVDNSGSPAPTGTVTLTGDTFKDNSTTVNGSGGGARVTADKVTITGTTFDGNSTGNEGGGLALTFGDQPVAPVPRTGTPAANATASITHTTFSNNQSGDYGCEGSSGGGLYASDFSGAPEGNRREADSGAGVLALGDNVYDTNVAGPPVECRYDLVGGGAAFVGIKAVAFTTETYKNNTVSTISGGEAIGGGFAVDSTNFSAGEYTGQNTVVINNTASRVPDPFDRARQIENGPSGGGIAVTGRGDYQDCTSERAGDNDPCAAVLDLIHATITGNTVSSTSGFGDDPVGAGIDGYKYETILVDRSIVAFNTVTDGTARQVNQSVSGDAQITNSDVTDQDLCEVKSRATPDGNICTDPVFVTPSGRSVAGSPIQDKSSPTVNAVDAVGTVTDDFLHKPRPALGKADMGAHELQPDPTPSPSPGPSPSPAPTVVVTPSPTPDDTGVEAQNNGHKKHVCGGRRYFPIVLRRIGYTFTRARITVNGKHVKTIRYTRGIKKGRLGARIDLRKFPRRTIRITITAKTSTGRIVRGKRVYHPCYRGRRPHTVPGL